MCVNDFPEGLATLWISHSLALTNAKPARAPRVALNMGIAGKILNLLHQGSNWVKKYCRLATTKASLSNQSVSWASSASMKGLAELKMKFSLPYWICLLKGTVTETGSQYAWVFAMSTGSKSIILAHQMKLPLELSKSGLLIKSKYKIKINAKIKIN